MRWSLERFLREAKQVHGDKYDYSKVTEPLALALHIPITCRACGKLWTPTLGSHVNGKAGCPACRKRLWTYDRFIQRGKEIHGNLIDYSHVSKLDVQNCLSKVDLLCANEKCWHHTEPWKTTVGMHIYSHAGCPSCSGNERFTYKKFIHKARAIYGTTIDYSLVSPNDIQNLDSTIQLLCTKENCKNKTEPWTMSVRNHVYSKTGCGACSGRDKRAAPVVYGLLKHEHPSLFAQMHPTLNVGIDIDALRSSSQVRVWWLCSNGHTWQTSVVSRAREESRCCQCLQRRKRSRTEKTEKVLSTIEIGDETEKYVVTLLGEAGAFLNVERIGQRGSKSDVVITHKDGKKTHLQVKTLVEHQSTSMDDFAVLTLQGQYPSDMLLAMCNKDRTRFVVEFFKNCKKGGMNFSFGGWVRHPKYEKIMFKDAAAFTQAIIDKSPFSTPFTSTFQFLGSLLVKELAMNERLALAATSNGLLFQENDTRGNAIDAYINGIPVQLKFTSFKEFQVYVVNSTRNAGRKQKRPYTESDPIEAVIVELGNSEGASLFPGQFCILPKTVLVEHRVFSNATQQGTMRLRVGPPNRIKPHWTLPFWNNWSFFGPPQVSHSVATCL